MAEHPLFAPYVQEENALDGETLLNPLTEGLAQLKYSPDHASPLEIAQNYKDEGVNHFRCKKYRFAIASFTEGIHQKCEDTNLNSQLYNNRAAAEWHLDCESAIELNPQYLKALLMAVRCAVKLKSWVEVFEFCDKGLFIEPSNEFLSQTRRTSIIEKKKSDRGKRKLASREKLIQENEQRLLYEIAQRGIYLDRELTISNLECSYLLEQKIQVYLSESNELIWPVLFLYPEYQESDFIKEFNENSRFCDHLEVMFGESQPFTQWDKSSSYRSGNLNVFFEDKRNCKVVEVDVNSSLKSILSDNRFVVASGTPSFLIIVKNSEFMNYYIAKFNKS